MMKDHIFNGYLDEITDRANSATNDHDAAAALVNGHLEAVLYHMVRDVPGVAEYLALELVRLKELNTLERI